jgi:hypothetical protein
MNMQNMSEDGTKMFQSSKILTMTAELLSNELPRIGYGKAAH